MSAQLDDEARLDRLAAGEVAALEHAAKRLRPVALDPIPLVSRVIDVRGLTPRQQRRCDLAGKWIGIVFWSALGYGIRYAIVAGRLAVQAIRLGVAAARRPKEAC